MLPILREGEPITDRGALVYDVRRTRWCSTRHSSSMRRASDRCLHHNARGCLPRSVVEPSSISSRVSNRLGCMSFHGVAMRYVKYIHSLDLIRCCDANLELSLCRLTICLSRELYCRVVIVEWRQSFVVRGYEWRDEAVVVRHAVIGPKRW